MSEDSEAGALERGVVLPAPPSSAKNAIDAEDVGTALPDVALSVALVEGEETDVTKSDDDVAEDEIEAMTTMEKCISVVSPIVQLMPPDACVANLIYSAVVEEETNVPPTRDLDRGKEKEKLREKFGRPSNGQFGTMLIEGISTRSKRKATIDVPLDRLRP